ncbi:MAG: hypothetical protein GY752_07880 [bacterium]|nr:hypothetical protein [bacterium]
MWKIILCLLLVSSIATAGDMPRSSLDRPDDTGPVLIGFGATGGGSVDYDKFTVGWSGSIIFRPAKASEFLTSLFYWNCGLVLHGDSRPYDADRKMLSADLLFRRYLSDVDDKMIYFVEAGPGAAHITFPVIINQEGDGGETTPTEAKRANRFYTGLVGCGFEYDLNSEFVVYSTLHWRYYDHNNLNYSGWNFTAGLAVPIPW